MKIIILIVGIIFNLNYLISQNLSWEPILPELGSNITYLTCDSTNRLIVQSDLGLFIVSDLDQIKRIDNLLSDTIRISCLAIDTSNTIFAGTFDDGVYKFNEAENTWQFASQGLWNQNIRNLSISFLNEIVVGTNTGHLIRTKVNDTAWTNINLPGSEFKLIKYNIFGDLFAVLYESIYLLKQNQSDWVRILSLASYDLINNLEFYNDELYVSTYNESAFYSRDTAKTWIHLYEGMGFDLNIKNVLVTNNKELILTSDSQGVYYSNTSGNSFEDNNSGLPSLKVLTGIVLNDRRILISIGASGLYISDPPKNNKIESGKWVLRNVYYEQDFVVKPITYIKTNSLNSTIFTNSADGSIRLWDLQNGNLISKIPNKKSVIDLNTDSLTYGVQGNNIWDVEAIIKVNSLNSDSCLKTIKLTKAAPFQGDEIPVERSYAYFSNNNKLIICNSVNKYMKGGIYNDLQTGVTDIWDYSTGELVYNLANNAKATSVAISNKHNYFAFSGYNFITWYHGNSYYTNFSYFVDSNFISHFFLDNSGESITSTLRSIQFSHDDEYILATMDKNIWIWKVPEMMPVSSFSLKADSNFSVNLSSYCFTMDSRRILISLTYLNNINSKGYINIQLRDLNGNIIKDSIFVKNDASNFIIRPIDGTTNFLLGGSDGILRMFDLNNYTHIIEKDNNIKDYFSLSPNPATDYIEINNVILRSKATKDPEIRVFDVLGIEHPATAWHPSAEGNIRLDISSLSPGVYFVRIGSYFAKFVKI